MIVRVETPLFERAGESSRHLARLARGTPVEVLSQNGRWLEAQASGLRGWLPRSTVDLADHDANREPPAENRAPIAPGGFGGAEVRAGHARKTVWMGPATLVLAASAGAARARPEPAAVAVFDVEAGSELRVAGQRSGNWLLVENAQGVVGWIPTSMLVAVAVPASDPEAAGAAAGAVASSVAAPPAETLAADYLARPRWIRASASLGVSSFTTTFSSNGTTQLADYRLSASAMAAFTGIELGMSKGRIRAALDGSYGVTFGMPGIRIRDGEGGSIDPVGFTWHHIDGGARVGYRMNDAVSSYLRAGYHFDWFRVDEVVNPGKLGRDGLQGFTAGFGLEAALSDELLVRAGGDALVVGRRKQTPGLEDGQRSSALAAWGRLEASYFTSRWLAIQGAYQYGWASTEWHGQSTRQADVTEAIRTDRIHLLLLSLRRDFR